MGKHRELDLFKLELSKYILDHFQLEEIIEKSKRNIQRWSEPSGETPLPYQEWLKLSPDDWRTIMVEDSDRGQQYRESMPYTGFISEKERGEIYEKIRS